MKLTLILGCMKSQKSLEIIREFGHMPFRRSRAKEFALFQPEVNTRDKEIESRTGAKLNALKIKSLSAILELGTRLKVVGIDEVHMFPESDAKVVKELVERGTDVVVSGLDLDYRGEPYPIVERLMRIPPDDIRIRRAVCDFCQENIAVFNQIILGETREPVLEGLPSVIPEEDGGKYLFQVACRACFKRKTPLFSDL